MQILLDEFKVFKNLYDAQYVAPCIEIYKENKTYSLLNLLLKNINNKFSIQKSERYSFGRIKKAEKYIHNNYMKDDISLDLISQSRHLSKFHFVRLFKKVVGKSPYDYLTEVRINKAIQIMRHKKHYDLNEVSFLVGFRHAAQLRYHFKRLKGHLPRESV